MIKRGIRVSKQGSAATWYRTPAERQYDLRTSKRIPAGGELLADYGKYYPRFWLGLHNEGAKKRSRSPGKVAVPHTCRYRVWDSGTRLCLFSFWQIRLLFWNLPITCVIIGAHSYESDTSLVLWYYPIMPIIKHLSVVIVRVFKGIHGLQIPRFLDFELFF